MTFRGHGLWVGCSNCRRPGLAADVVAFKMKSAPISPFETAWFRQRAGGFPNGRIQALLQLGRAVGEVPENQQANRFMSRIPKRPPGEDPVGVMLVTDNWEEECCQSIGGRWEEECAAPNSVTDIISTGVPVNRDGLPRPRFLVINIV
ncbi:hypothetical protein CWR43_31500 [Rhizobium sullae]|uniref:Uncharacterized protein n=1 Tax=Rhizobium sullae TaxID=50338 RepID=A0A2N0D0Y6_RHISU|nr:hypothetical protein CWR43_31500 [Rhizobium sullae]